MFNQFKFYFLSFFICLVCSACSSTEDPGPITMDPEKEEEIIEEDVFPESFSQKILMEKVSRESCGFCPGLTQYLLDYTDTIDNTILISIQKDDDLEIPFGEDLFSYLVEPGAFLAYPLFSFNRLYPEDSKVANFTSNKWDQGFAAAKKTATLGLAIDSKVTNDLLDIEIKIASLENENSSKLTIYLYEEDHPESSPGSQANGNGTAASPYLHHNLLVDVVTEQFSILDKVGDEITIKKDEFLIKNYTNIDISAFNQDKLHILAYVHRDNDPYNIEVNNSQFARIGTKKDFD